MKRLLYFFIIVTIIISCKKEDPKAPAQTVNPNPNPQPNPNPADTFTTYIIKQGKNFCENNGYALFSQSIIKFKVIFDSSCIYTNVDPNNQADINKLYGFADCNSFHQINSARFGWNWNDGKMRLHAYCYVDSIRQFKELGTVELNKEITCSLETLPGKYVFTLNGKKDTVERHCTDTIAIGYKLLPYFGGDESAPHEVRIKIKELK